MSELQTPESTEYYLHEHIPLSREMGVAVVSCGAGGVTLSAPLAPNVNHRHTAFGGSVSALAILAAWTLVHTRLQSVGAYQVVIQSNAIEYRAPVLGEFEARCAAPANAEWERFEQTLTRRGKARLSLGVDVYTGAVLAAVFRGEYVALKRVDGDAEPV